MCKVLEIARSEYYYQRNKKKNRYKEANEKLDKEILKEYENSKGRYGSPKVQKALEKRWIKAIQNARNKGKFKTGAIFHSDLGSQYTSNKVERYLKELDLKHSYSKKGYPYDNASMESFNAILKKEEVNLHEYKTFEEARRVIFEFIESWYNRRRIHSAINYRTPEEIEKQAVWKKNERLLKNKKNSQKKCPKTWHRTNVLWIWYWYNNVEN